MLDVKVKIDLTKPIGTSIGFGVPLILEENAEKEVVYTEVGGLDEVVTAGFTDSTDVYKAAKLLFRQGNAPAKIAVCATTGTATEWLADVDNTNKDWRQLIVVGENDSVADIMAAVEALPNKLYFASLQKDASTALTVTDVERTVLFYCDSTEGCPDPVAALVGATAGLPAGSFTYKNMILEGIEPQALKATELKAIHDKGGISFVTKAGDNVTTEGKVAGGEYIDIIDSKDYIVMNMEYAIQKVLNQSAKIPYTDTGIAILESAAVAILRNAYTNGMIAENEDGTPAYSVSFARSANVQDTNRAGRRYILGQFSFKLSGAIHEVEVTGEMII